MPTHLKRDCCWLWMNMLCVNRLSQTNVGHWAWTNTEKVSIIWLHVWLHIPGCLCMSLNINLLIECCLGFDFAWDHRIQMNQKYLWWYKILELNSTNIWCCRKILQIVCVCVCVCASLPLRPRRRHATTTSSGRLLRCFLHRFKTWWCKPLLPVCLWRQWLAVRWMPGRESDEWK